MVREFHYEIYDNLEALKTDDKKLVKAAIETTSDAYAPYSKFKVGASIRLDNGSIVIGHNQENAVYPLGLCAERVALFSAGSQYPNETITAIAVATEKKIAPTDIPPFPCGSCRQTLIEFESKQQQPIKLLVTGTNERVFVFKSVQSILPFAFNDLFL